MKLAKWVFAAAVTMAAALTAQAADVSNTNRFYPIPLEPFYQRALSNYAPNTAWGSVPRGIIEFDGIPFRMFGQIEMNGLGPSRDKNFQPARVGEIPVKRRASRLHLISGAGYKDPDGTPLAEVRLHYTNGEARNIFINYGDHVRNWHVESDEKRTDVAHPQSGIIWNGINGATGRPLRLFKNTFDNPIPTHEIRAIELLSLFGRAFPLFCAITLETTDEKLPARADSEEPDDTPFRREMLIRISDRQTGHALSNAWLNVTAVEDGRGYGFGRYRSDRHGQILFDYPPGRFSSIRMEFSLPGYSSHATALNNAEGAYGPELIVKLGQQ
jgi:hypothetical protein